ncbi:hypothetical protein Alsa1_CDS0129 [Staphylococcus phage Alsa_1]|nr:hypothetical protein Alsa1_CDS0129 [Staphylococcus phage Alsa_1]
MYVASAYWLTTLGKNAQALLFDHLTPYLILSYFILSYLLSTLFNYLNCLLLTYPYPTYILLPILTLLTSYSYTLIQPF